MSTKEEQKQASEIDTTPTTNQKTKKVVDVMTTNEFNLYIKLKEKSTRQLVKLYYDLLRDYADKDTNAFHTILFILRELYRRNCHRVAEECANNIGKYCSNNIFGRIADVIDFWDYMDNYSYE